MLVVFVIGCVGRKEGREQGRKEGAAGVDALWSSAEDVRSVLAVFIYASEKTHTYNRKRRVVLLLYYCRHHLTDACRIYYYHRAGLMREMIAVESNPSE